MYLGEGISTWTVISSSSRMKEQTMLDLNSSSLICEYWDKRRMIDDQLPKTPEKHPAPYSKSKCYLSFHVRVLKHLSERGDVLFPHPLTASNLHGLTNPLVDFPWPRSLSCELIGQLGERAIGEGGQDLQGEHKRSTPHFHIVWDFSLKKVLVSSQNSFPGCLQTAAPHSKSSSRHNLDALLSEAQLPLAAPGGSGKCQCCVSVGTRCAPSRAPPPSRKSHPDSPEWPERHESA